jgi:hypothetical protein
MGYIGDIRYTVGICCALYQPRYGYRQPFPGKGGVTSSGRLQEYPYSILSGDRITYAAEKQR